MTTTSAAPRSAASVTSPGPSPLALGIGLLASMRLTVALLVTLGVLTYVGTLAQVDRGLYDVQKEYFESFLVLHDTGIAIGSKTLHIPLPGAYPVMVLLFANLIVGGLVRLRWSLRNVGILITHLGMALLLIAGFVKLHFSYSGHVAIYEGKASSTIVSFHDYELVLLRQQDGKLHERTMPEAALLPAARRPLRLDTTGLPFDIEVSHWLDNCRPMQKGPMFAAETPIVTDGGIDAFLQPLPVEREREHNHAGCYVTVTVHGRGELSARTHRGMLNGRDFRPFDDRRYPFTFVADDVTWGLDLRRVVWDLPFSVKLDKFEKRDHPGTMTPRDFSSWVTVTENGVGRPAHIYMNAPLRKDGLVFFQTSWGPQPNPALPPEEQLRGPPWWSIFEVADNPSDAWPKYSSYVVLLGLLVHFVQKLRRYLDSSSHRANVA